MRMANVIMKYPVYVNGKYVDGIIGVTRLVKNDADSAGMHHSWLWVVRNS